MLRRQRRKGLSRIIDPTWSLGALELNLSDFLQRHAPLLFPLLLVFNLFGKHESFTPRRERFLLFHGLDPLPDQCERRRRLLHDCQYGLELRKLADDRFEDVRRQPWRLDLVFFRPMARFSEHISLHFVRRKELEEELAVLVPEQRAIGLPIGLNVFIVLSLNGMLAVLYQEVL